MSKGAHFSIFLVFCLIFDCVASCLCEFKIVTIITNFCFVFLSSTKTVGLHLEPLTSLGRYIEYFIFFIYDT